MLGLPRDGGRCGAFAVAVGCVESGRMAVAAGGMAVGGAGMAAAGAGMGVAVMH
ncbi:hypothetical protein DEO72_LG4g510 [Vigna unguiculata]|uniref:Uncharacterized protein n=1 Tax=Vigna unguiculata TaxID=3917 RepID=A0A4D6LNG2_VIGUN|nr:hypothetical protein DEO72_LG4g510 [Vigna unguiculata]